MVCIYKNYNNICFVTLQTDSDRCSVPLDVVTVITNVLCEECKQHGDFEKGKFSQSMTDFLNKTRQAKDHYDRDTLTHDIYYATLNLAEVTMF